MPVQVQGPDGATYQFPDGTDKNAAIGYFKKKGIGAKASPKKSLVDALTEIQPHQAVHSASGLGREALRGVGNIGAGGLGVLLHPIKTAEGALESIGGVITAPAEMLSGSKFKETIPGQLVESLRTQPLETVEQGIGQAGAMGGVTEAGGAALKAVPKVLPNPGKVIRNLYGAGPKGMVESATKTAEQANTAAESAEAANKAAEEKTLLDRGKVEKKNAGQLLKEAEERKKAKGANRAATQDNAAAVEKTKVENEAALKQQGKIEPTQEKLKTAGRELQAQIETAREKALKVGNEKYSAVNEKLNPVEADFGNVSRGLEEAAGKIKGSQVRGAEANPRILDDIQTRIQKGDTFTYEDLQGYYSELNRELSKGTLPGDVYAAYDTLHDAVGNEMQRIADEHGVGGQLSDARNYWRRMKQTFGKPYNPSDAATGVLEKATGQGAAEEQANRVRLLGSFDPAIPQTVEHIGNIRKGIESLPKPKPLRDILKPSPTAPEPKPIPKPSPLTPYGEPEPTRPIERPELEPRAIREKNVADKMANWKTLNKYQIAHLASGAVGMVFEALSGKLGYEGMTSIYTAAPLTPIALAKLADIPAVREWLTRPQPGDLEALRQIPHADRVRIIDTFKGVANQAAKSGKPISMSPEVAAALGIAAPKQRPGDILRQAQ